MEERLKNIESRVASALELSEDDHFQHYQNLAKLLATQCVLVEILGQNSAEKQKEIQDKLFKSENRWVETFILEIGDTQPAIADKLKQELKRRGVKFDQDV